MKKGASKDIDKEIIFDEVSAPVNIGDKIGEIVYKQDGEELKNFINLFLLIIFK